MILLLFIALIGCNGLRLEVEDHGFLLNWITVVPSVSTTLADNYEQISKYSRNFYFFAKYFSKLSTPVPEFPNSNQINTQLILSINSKNSFPTLGLGIVNLGHEKFQYQDIPLYSKCQNDSSIEIETLDSSFNSDKTVFTISVGIKCNEIDLTEIGAQAFQGLVNNALRERVVDSHGFHFNTNIMGNGVKVLDQDRIIV